MKKFMCIYLSDEGPGAWFFDTHSEAENFRMNCTCGMGWQCQVYEYDPLTEWYEFSYE